MRTLIQFVMIRAAHRPTLVIPILLPLAGMICSRFGRGSPLFAAGAVVALGWLWRSMSIRMRLIGRTSSLASCCWRWNSIAPEPRLASTAQSRAPGRSSPSHLLGGVLQQGGPLLFSRFHLPMAIAAVACVLATLAGFIIEPGPEVDSIPRD
ncbi:hypothetical protein [Bradyrhizobium sp. UNPA324]|uniref:hypothetical protein n=1 Tax=Bradyrhizobium sp. UNPA324 TaxID=1141174 RepID=UPI0011513C10|nr:hypothetical protein [Bradyrhizobium sp. UNPA324]